MYILLKLDYAKFGVSNLLFSKVIKEKPEKIRLPKIRMIYINLFECIIHSNGRDT